MRKVLTVASGAVLLGACTLSTFSLSDLSAPTTGVSSPTPTVTSTGVASPTPTPPCNPTFFSVQAVPGTTMGQVLFQVTSDSFSLSETAGDLLVAIAYGGQHPGASSPPTVAPNMTFNVSDTLGNTYYPGPLIVNTNSNQAAIQMFYAANIHGGSNKVTATSTGGPSVPLSALWTALFLQEYAGVATNDALDISSGQMAQAKTLAMTPGAVETTRCDLVVGAFTDGHVDGQNLQAVFDPAWPYRSTDNFDPGGAVDNAPDGAQANTIINATMNLTNAANDGPDEGWVAAQMAFRAANWSATPQPNELVFVTPSRNTSVASTCSPPVTLASGSSGQAVTTSKGITVDLAAQPGLTFYADSGCLYPITGVFIGAGTSSKTFYFESSATGSFKISATAAGFAPVVQTEN